MCIDLGWPRLEKNMLLVTRSSIYNVQWACSSTPTKKIARSESHPLPRRTFDVLSSHWLSPGHGHPALTQVAAAAGSQFMSVPCLARTAPATSVHLALRSPHSVHSEGSVRCSRGSVDARTSGHGGPVTWALALSD